MRTHALRSWLSLALAGGLVVSLGLSAGGCPIDLNSLLGLLDTSGQVTGDQAGDDQAADTDTDMQEVYNNTADPTNNGAKYIGSASCKACHPGVAEEFRLSGHAYKLNRITDGAPQYPDQADRAGGFEPPEGKTWQDIAYVIGGYIRKARFVTLDGYVMTDGVDGVHTQWNLDFPANGTEAGWVAYEPDRTEPKPYAESCFRCHTTGPQPFDENHPTFQDNRPGMMGTFAEPGVQCEACHGPGSNHIPNPSARDMFVDVANDRCKACHTRPYGDDSGKILASGGFIKHHEQWPELKASGGHSSFTCTTCHDAHRGTNYDDKDKAIRNKCEACHADQNMALHEGKVYVRGNYVEELDCTSCHMPYATKSGSKTVIELTDPATGGTVTARIGDMRTHIFRIDTRNVDYTAMFNDDMTEVVRDAQGRAAVTVDFVCLRCHNGTGNAFPLAISSAATIATGMHE